jgi:hypothetical protein
MSTTKANATIAPELIVKGVDQAMWAWLVDNSTITVPTAIEDAIGSAFTAWPDANRETILEKIADKVARGLAQNGNDSARTAWNSGGLPFTSAAAGNPSNAAGHAQVKSRNIPT